MRKTWFHGTLFPMNRHDLLSLLNTWLEPEKYKDVAENGLQIEGCETIQSVVCGVSANRNLIERAIDENADAIFVHHGLVWGGGIRTMTGWLRERIALLMKHNISLFAYHLPLDAHPTLGNNAGLSKAIGMEKNIQPFGRYKGQSIGLCGELSTPMPLSSFADRIAQEVGPPLCVFGNQDKHIAKVGVCSGGAPDLLHEAIEVGLDAYITGEVTEWVKSVADESQVAFIAGGHHATERFGARQVAEALNREGHVRAIFVDVENPA